MYVERHVRPKYAGRQVARFERIGVPISRQDMGNRTIAAAGALTPLIERIRSSVRAGPIINMDKKQNGRTQARVTCGLPGVLVSLRAEPHDGLPRKLLADYTGFVQADAFRVYKIVAGEEPGITLVGCWAHVRRRFFEATKGSKKAGAAHEGLRRVTTLYRIQSEMCALDLTDDEFLRRRREATEPHLEKFRTWLTRKSEAVIPQSLLGKAVA